MKKIKISGSAYVAIIKHLTDGYPDEVCGILLGKDESVEGIIPVNNIDTGKKKKIHFGIDPLELYEAELKAADANLEVMGFVHSHPDRPAILSGEDERFMIPGMLYVIVSATKESHSDPRGFIKPVEEEKYREVIISVEE